MNEFFVMPKALMAQIVDELKQLELHKFEDYGRLVGVVCLLEKNLNAKPVPAQNNEEQQEGG